MAGKRRRFTAEFKARVALAAKIRDLYAKIGELTVERELSARAQALSHAERVGMIGRDGPLSLSRRCALVG